MRSAALSALLGLLVAGCQPAPYCADTCALAHDGECDDGREGAVSGLCRLGTDCTDCGVNQEALDPEDPPDIDPPGPPPFPPPADPPTEVPPPPGGGSCVCPDEPYYCSGPRQVVFCGDQVDPDDPPPPPGAVRPATPCTTRAQNCERPGEHGPFDYHCRDGANGIDCYAENLEHCWEVGVCGEDTLQAGATVEDCMRIPASMRELRLGGFDVDVCERWFQAGGNVISCGACRAGCEVDLPTRVCNTSMPRERCEGAGAGADNFDCGDDCIPASQVCNGTEDCSDGSDEEFCGPTVSPGCRSAIDSQLRALRSASTGDACFDGCLDRFVDCMERTNCGSSTSCQSTASSCITRC